MAGFLKTGDGKCIPLDLVKFYGTEDLLGPPPELQMEWDVYGAELDEEGIRFGEHTG